MAKHSVSMRLWLCREQRRRRGFTLLEMFLVMGLLALLTATVVPNLLGWLMQEQLPKSAEQMRSVLQLTRATAMLEGKRYRLRFPRKDSGDDELDSEGTRVQPIIECESEPFKHPGIFYAVDEVWTRGETLLNGVRCVRVRMGKPTIEQLLENIDDVTAELDEEAKDDDEIYQEWMEEWDEDFPPIVFETDGTSEWFVFIITDAPEDADEDSLAEYSRIEVIYDGFTGLAWLQRPFEEEELRMMQENGWPPVLRKDFLRKELLTEEEVIEIHESAVRR